MGKGVASGRLTPLSRAHFSLASGSPMFSALADHCRSSQKIKSLLEMWLQILKAAHHVMNTDGPSGRKPRTTVVHMFIRQDTDTK